LTRFELPLGTASTAPDGRCRMISKESSDNQIKQKKVCLMSLKQTKKRIDKIAGN